MSKNSGKKATVALVMGSISDLEILDEAIKTLQEFKISVHVEILSAHRTPKKMLDFATNAKKLGFKIIIAGAGGAAHLPGMIAAATVLPVIGVPIKSKNSLIGLDSLLSIVQMPAGVPVATMAIDGAKNAALFAIMILGISHSKISKQLENYKNELEKKVEEMNNKLTSVT